MNWTGGRLQRSKNANKGIIQKQKAHFARARAQLLYPTRARTPALPSYFIGEERATQRPPFPPPKARTPHLTEGALQSHDRSIAASPIHHDRRETHGAAERRPLLGHDRANAVSSGNTSRKYRLHQDDNPDADDPGERLFEEKKKELLRQSDWAGLGRPKRPTLNSKARQERDNMCKRRKTSRHNALAIRKGPSTPVPLTQATTRRQLGGGAHQDHDIRIRIGNDALTNRTTMQTSSQAEAPATPYDASLENTVQRNAILHRGASKPGQQADPNACGFVGAPTHAHHPQNSTRGGTPPSQQLHYFRGSVAGMRAGLNERYHASPNDRSIVDSPAGDNVSLNKRGEVSNYDIAQQLEGIARSLRLTFDMATESSAMAPIENASSCNLIGESNHDHYTANAAATGSGNVQMEAGAAGSAKFRLPRSINEGPRMAFLPVQAISSSLSVADGLPALNRAHDRPPLHPLYDSASWSQQATQGARTPADASLCVSPSLPSITRKGEKDELRKQVHVGAGRSGRSNKRINENDEFWQRLVFGIYKVDSTDGLPGIAAGRNKTIMDERRTTASVAVSRNSTPFDPRSGPGFCVSDSTQAAATRAPLVTYSGSMLPMITSSTAPLSHDQVRKLDKDSGYTTGVGDSDFGLQSMTHTSMRNNVSSDANSSYFW